MCEASLCHVHTVSSCACDEGLGRLEGGMSVPCACGVAVPSAVCVALSCMPEGFVLRCIHCKPSNESYSIALRRGKGLTCRQCGMAALFCLSVCVPAALFCLCARGVVLCVCTWRRLSCVLDGPPARGVEGACVGIQLWSVVAYYPSVYI